MKKNNKGFSLVELIIVIAIMAVLVAVLAPQYIKYVEKSRVQKDESAAGEVLQAAKIAMADTTVYDFLSAAVTDKTKDQATVATVAMKDDEAIQPTNALETEVTSVVGTTLDFSSNAHAGQTYTVTISYAASSKTFTATGAFGS